MRKTLILSLILLVLSFCGQAQFILAPTLVAAGGQYEEIGLMTISWSIGELAVTTLRTSNIILTQGFQQSFEPNDDVWEGKYDTEGAIQVYPNPVGQTLFVRFGIEGPGRYIIEMHDVTGRVMIQTLEKLVEPGDVVQIRTSAYSPGIYLLKIIKSDGTGAFVTSIRKI